MAIDLHMGVDRHEYTPAIAVAMPGGPAETVVVPRTATYSIAELGRFARCANRTSTVGRIRARLKNIVTESSGRL